MNTEPRYIYIYILIILYYIGSLRGEDLTFMATPEPSYPLIPRTVISVIRVMARGVACVELE